MKIDLLDHVLTKLNEFESSNPYDTREIETCMEALATQIALFMGLDTSKVETLSDAIKALPIGKK